MPERSVASCWSRSFGRAGGIASIPVATVALEKQKHAAILEGATVSDMEERGHGLEEIAFRKPSIQIVAAAQPLLKHGIGGRHPFDEQPALRETGAEPGDVGERNLLTQDEVMNHGEQKHQVEPAGDAVEKGKLL